jgi:DNA-binding transcriptional ArsR family regulator
MGALSRTRHGAAADLADLFKVMANDTRLRLLHALVREGELCVSELCEQTQMKPLSRDVIDLPDGEACPSDDVEPRDGWPPLPG